MRQKTSRASLASSSRSSFYTSIETFVERLELLDVQLGRLFAARVDPKAATMRRVPRSTFVPIMFFI